MDKDFKQYVYARCEKALLNDNKYQQLNKILIQTIENKDNGSKEEVRDEMESRAEMLCYIQGFRDGLKKFLQYDEL